MNARSILLIATTIVAAVAARSSVVNNNNDLLQSPDITIKAGDVATIPIALTRCNSANFTTISFNLHFPEFIHPSLNEEWNCYGWEGDDIPIKSRVPVLTFIDNLGTATLYPNHTVTGINSTMTPISLNPCEMYVLNIACDKDAISGVVELTANTVSYSDSNGDTYNSTESQVVCRINILGTTPPVDVTDVSKLDYAIYSTSSNMKSGTQSKMYINMKNMTDITLWQTDMELPEGFSIATKDLGDLSVSISGERTWDTYHSIWASSRPDGTTRLLCSSINNRIIQGKDGEVATIMLNVDKDVQDGEYPVKFHNIKLVEPDQTCHRLDNVNCKIVVKNYLRGDVNGDGVVDVDDVNALINVLLGFVSPDRYEGRAYVNSDDMVDVDDLNMTLNILLGF